MANEFGAGVAIERITVTDLRALDIATVNGFERAKQAHREDCHSFFLLETGTVQLEVDFQHYTVESSTVIYLHPDQVHRVLSFDNVTVSSWAISTDNLNPDYLTLLDDITPAPPLVLTGETFSLLSEAVSLCLKVAERQGWRTSELLEEVEQAKTVYFDKFCQIRMPSWTKGRVALVGDAGYCASPASGMGASLAIYGAATVAEALQKHNGEFGAAFQEYNQTLRPLIDAVQATAIVMLTERLIPQTEEAIRKRNTQQTPF